MKRKFRRRREGLNEKEKISKARRRSRRQENILKKRRRLDGEAGPRLRGGSESRYDIGRWFGNRDRPFDHDPDKRSEYSRRDLLPAAST